MPDRESTAPDLVSDSEHFNFQNQQDIAALVQLLSAPLGTRVPPILLAGEAGIGRRYLLQAALNQTRLTQPNIRCAEMDLTGYDPDNPATFPEFVDEKLEDVSEEYRQSFYQLVEMLFAGSQEAIDAPATPAPTLRFASAVCLLPTRMNLADSLDLFHETFAELRRVGGNYWKLLDLILAPLTRDRRLVLHFPDSATIAEPLRAFYEDEAKRHPNLVLVYSCSATDDSYSITFTDRSRRFELSALHRGELAHAMERQFRTRALEPLIEPLMDYSRGRAGLIARAVRDIVSSGGILFDPGEGWRVASDQPGHPSVKKLAGCLYGRVVQALDTVDADQRPALERWLWAAALCGDWLPVRPLLGFAGVPKGEEDQWIELIDSCFADVFEDLGYQDQRWSGQLLYAFRDPDLAAIVLDHCPLDRSRLSAQLAEFLEPLIAPGSRDATLLLWKAAQFHSNTRQYVERKLRWWVDQDLARTLTTILRHRVARGKEDPKRLLAAALGAEGTAPPWRTLALANALVTPTEDGELSAVPEGRVASLLALRARLLLRLGRYRRAEVLLAQAFKARVREDGEEAAFLNSVSRCLAMTWLRLGGSAQWAFRRDSGAQLIPRAEFTPAAGENGDSPVDAFLVRMLAVRSGRRGDEDSSVVPPLRLLSSLRRRQGSYQEAETLLRRALANQEARLGTDHPNLAGTLVGLGSLKFQQAEYSQAEEFLQRALGLASSHRALSSVLHVMGLLNEARGKRDEARRFMIRAFEIRKANFGADHPETRATGLELKRLGEAGIL